MSSAMDAELEDFQNFLDERTNLSTGSKEMYTSYVSRLQQPLDFQTMDTTAVKTILKEEITTNPVRSAFLKYLKYKLHNAKEPDTEEQIQNTYYYLKEILEVRKGDTPSKKEIKKKYLTTDQIQKFHNHVTEQWSGDRHYLDLKTLPFLLYETGCRIREILPLVPGQISWDDQQIHIIRAKRGQTRDVDFDISESLLREIVDARQDENKLFRMPYWRVRYVFANIGKDLFGLDGPNDTGKDKIRLTPHWFRHSFATNWAIKGIQSGKSYPDIREEIRQYLGHTDTDSTEIYIEAAEELERDNIFTEHGGFDISI